MISLYESLLDDFEELEDKQDKTIKQEDVEKYLEKSDWKLGKDGKTIMFVPREYYRYNQPSLLFWDRDTLEDCVDYKAVDICSRYGLKWQPLDNVGNVLGNIPNNYWLEKLECEYTSTIIIKANKHDKILDFSKTKFDVLDMIHIINSYDSCLEKIIPYKKHIETLYIDIQRKPLTPKLLEGWDCDNLILSFQNLDIYSDGIYNMSGSDFENTINIILKNNPNVKTIYFTNFEDKSIKNKFRIITKGKGSKRAVAENEKIKNIITSRWNSMKLPSHNANMSKHRNDIDSWMYSHRDLIEK